MATYTEQENHWTTATKSGFPHEDVPFELHWEADYSPVCDDYTPEDITAFELFKLWSRQAGKKHGDIIPIYWYVTGDGIFEQAPFCVSAQKIDKEIGRDTEDFSSSYRLPVHVISGEPINWGRVPVKVGDWVPGGAFETKSDFIVTATGWRPSPLQESVSLSFLTYCANAERAAHGDEE